MIRSSLREGGSLGSSVFVGAFGGCFCFGFLVDLLRRRRLCLTRCAEERRVGIPVLYIDSNSGCVVGTTSDLDSDKKCCSSFLVDGS